MKRMILNILATTGVTLVVLAIVALCHGGTVLFIRAVFEALGLNTVIYAGIYVMNRFEYRYPILETGLKLVYVLALVLTSGWIFGWYANLSAWVLGGMAIVIFGICVCLDTLNLIDEVKTINGLLEQDKKNSDIIQDK